MQKQPVKAEQAMRVTKLWTVGQGHPTQPHPKPLTNPPPLRMDGQNLL